VPRAKPFTEADVKARSKVARSPANFDDAIRVLGVAEDDWLEATMHLETIFLNYDLEVLTEEQETPERKAAAIAIVRNRVKRQIKKGQTANIHRSENPHERRLAPALAMEVVREMQRGLALLDSLEILHAKYSKITRSGRRPSYALRNLIHMLEVFATTWNDNLEGGKLLNFLREALQAAQVRFPDLEENRSKFNRLRVGYVAPRAPCARPRPRVSRAHKEARLAKWRARFYARINLYLSVPCNAD
jgi:hypothetical protein